MESRVRQPKFYPDRRLIGICVHWLRGKGYLQYGPKAYSHPDYALLLSIFLVCPHHHLGPLGSPSLKIFTHWNRPVNLGKYWNYGNRIEIRENISARGVNRNNVDLKRPANNFPQSSTHAPTPTNKAGWLGATLVITPTWQLVKVPLHGSIALPEHVILFLFSIRVIYIYLPFSIYCISPAQEDPYWQIAE